MQREFTVFFNTTTLAQQIPAKTIQTTKYSTLALTTFTTYNSSAGATSPLLTQEFFEIMRAVFEPGQ